MSIHSFRSFLLTFSLLLIFISSFLTVNIFAEENDPSSNDDPSSIEVIIEENVGDNSVSFEADNETLNDPSAESDICEDESAAIEDTYVEIEASDPSNESSSDYDDLTDENEQIDAVSGEVDDIELPFSTNEYEDLVAYLRHYKFRMFMSNGEYHYTTTTESNNILKSETYAVSPSDLNMMGSTAQPDLSYQAPYDEIDISDPGASVVYIDDGDEIKGFCTLISVGKKIYKVRLGVEDSDRSKVLINVPLYYCTYDRMYTEYGKDYSIDIKGPSVTKKLKEAAKTETRNVYGKGFQVVSANTLLLYENLASRLKMIPSIAHKLWFSSFISDNREETLKELQKFSTVEEFEADFKTSSKYNDNKYIDDGYFSGTETVDDLVKRNIIAGFIKYNKFKDSSLSLDELKAGKRFEVQEKSEIVFNLTNKQFYDVWFAEMKNWDGHWKHFVTEGDTELYKTGKLGWYYGNYGNFDCKVAERRYDIADKYDYGTKICFNMIP